MALTTPINLTQRGLTANAGVLTTKYPHSAIVDDTPVKKVTIIFSGADATTTKGAAIAQNDVLPLINIPAGSFVLPVAAKVLTVEGGASTVDIGDGATADGYLDGLDINALTDTQSFTADTTEAFGAGKYYAAADTIDLKLMTGTAAAVVIAVSAVYIVLAPAVTS
jgi:hypothetical protein